MYTRIEHDAEWYTFQHESKQYLQDQVCKIWKKALQYANTRRAGFLEGFKGGIECSDWTGYPNKKIFLWEKQVHGTDQQPRGPLICALSMAHVRSD